MRGSDEILEVVARGTVISRFRLTPSDHANLKAPVAKGVERAHLAVMNRARGTWPVKRPIISAIAGTALLAGCGKGQSHEESKGVPQRPAIDGYRAIKLGSTFEANVAALGSDRFNPYGVKECLDDLPLRGCAMGSLDGRVYDVRDGISYALSLVFNKHDKLTDIELQYKREGNISKAECLSISERTLDWLVTDYGPFGSARNPKETTQMTPRKTLAGNPYFVALMSGDFVTVPMRTEPSSLVANKESLPITKWGNERYASLLSTFILVDKKPICDVTVEFSEPQSVERNL